MLASAKDLSDRLGQQQNIKGHLCAVAQGHLLAKLGVRLLQSRTNLHQTRCGRLAHPVSTPAPLDRSNKRKWTFLFSV